MLKAFSSGSPVPVSPASWPTNEVVRDGIIAGTYRMCLKDGTTGIWYANLSAYSSHFADDPPYWDFYWTPFTLSGSYKFNERAVVTSTGTPYLGWPSHEFGPGDWEVGDTLNLGMWVKTS